MQKSHFLHGAMRKTVGLSHKAKPLKDNKGFDYYVEIDKVCHVLPSSLPNF